MARMTQKLVNEIWAWTNECYKEALLECYPAEIGHLKELNHRELRIELINRGMDPHRNKQVDEKCIEKLKKLSTKKINLIIEANDKGKIRGAPTTINSLMDELFERAANEESDKASE